VSDSDRDEPFVYVDPAVLAGHWADRTVVHKGSGEFTIDFVRRTPDPHERVLVARAIVAPWVAMDLRDQIDKAWRGYPEWPMQEDS
jgi:hypothetical protein